MTASLSAIEATEPRIELNDDEADFGSQPVEPSADGEPEPASIANNELIDGADLLERVHRFILRFVCFPSPEAGVAVVLWSAHAHLIDAWDTTPRLAFLSAEPGSGKSRAMEIAALLCPRSIEAANATTASIVRAMDDPAGIPTFFIDEIDTKYRENAKGDEELRGLINSGYKRNGSFMRCEKDGDNWVPVLKPCYSALAMAGIGNLPDTILSRSVVIKMRTRASYEKSEPFRIRDHEHIGHALRGELESWATQVMSAAAKARPSLPDEIVDRKADVWEPLIVIGDLAGGIWPKKARDAATYFVGAAKKEVSASLGVQLLSDIRRCFGDQDRLPSIELIDKLLADEEAPWADLKGKKLDQRRLAKMLAPYGIKPVGVRMPSGGTPRGYRRDHFHDAWQRYLPAVQETATSDTTATMPDDTQETGHAVVADDDHQA